MEGKYFCVFLTLYIFFFHELALPIFCLFFYHSESHKTLKIQTKKNPFKREPGSLENWKSYHTRNWKHLSGLIECFKGETKFKHFKSINGGARLVLNSVTPLDRTRDNEWNFRLYLRRTFRRVQKQRVDFQNEWICVAPFQINQTISLFSVSCN